MMYKGPLFHPEEFAGGSQGEGLNLSIPQFRELEDKRLEEWMNCINWGEQNSSKEKQVRDELKKLYQWWCSLYTGRKRASV